MRYASAEHCPVASRFTLYRVPLLCMPLVVLSTFVRRCFSACTALKTSSGMIVECVSVHKYLANSLLFGQIFGEAAGSRCFAAKVVNGKGRLKSAESQPRAVKWLCRTTQLKSVAAEIGHLETAVFSCQQYEAGISADDVEFPPASYAIRHL